MIRAIVMIFIGVVAVIRPTAAADDDVPVSVRADILGRKIVKEVATKQIAAALLDLTEYRKLGVPVPPPLMYTEAKLADASGDPVRAYEAVKGFLNTADKNSSHYTEALDLYAKLESDPRVQFQRSDDSRVAAERANAAKVARDERYRQYEADYGQEGCNVWAVFVKDASDDLKIACDGAHGDACEKIGEDARKYVSYLKQCNERIWLKYPEYRGVQPKVR